MNATIISIKPERLDRETMTTDLLRPHVENMWKSIPVNTDRSSEPSWRGLVLAHYILGLTSPFYNNAQNYAQIKVFKRLLANTIGDERADLVLCDMAVPPKPYLVDVLEAAEQVGWKDGFAISSDGNLARRNGAFF